MNFTKEYIKFFADNFDCITRSIQSEIHKSVTYRFGMSEALFMAINGNNQSGDYTLNKIASSIKDVGEKFCKQFDMTSFSIVKTISGIVESQYVNSNDLSKCCRLGLMSFDNKDDDGLTIVVILNIGKDFPNGNVREYSFDLATCLDSKEESVDCKGTKWEYDGNVMINCVLSMYEHLYRHVDSSENKLNTNEMIYNINKDPFGSLIYPRLNNEYSLDELMLYASEFLYNIMDIEKYKTILFHCDYKLIRKCFALSLKVSSNPDVEYKVLKDILSEEAAKLFKYSTYSDGTKEFILNTKYSGPLSITDDEMVGLYVSHQSLALNLIEVLESDTACKELVGAMAYVLYRDAKNK